MTPMPPVKSMYVLPSTSVTVESSARSTKIGCRVATPASTDRRRRSINARLRGPGMAPSSRMTPISIPPDRRFRQVDVDLLGLEVVLQTVRTELASESGLLVPAPGRLVVGRMVGVQPEDAGADLFQDPDAAKHIS